MREDMARVVIERPRYHSSGRYREVRPRDVTRRDIETLGDLPHCEGMRRPHVRRKSLFDLLGPLRKFLVRQVGRPWDNVYSEICERISPNSTVQLHILGHLEGVAARLQRHPETHHAAPRFAGSAQRLRLR